MFVLLQVYPPEATGDDDRCCCLDVIAVDPSEAALEQYLAAYQPRYQAATTEFDLSDDMAGDWGPAHDCMHMELTDKYDVYGSLIQGTRFKIVRCLAGARPAPARAA